MLKWLRAGTPLQRFSRSLLWFGLLCALTPARAAATLELQDCRLEHPLKLSSVAAYCGELSVPEDREQPQGAKIALRVARIPALNRRSNGAPLFILAGGPGQGAADLYTGFVAAFARAGRNHDIVLVDQRGTGASNALRCAYPDDWSEAANSPTAIRDLTNQCLKNLGMRVRFYTTANAIRDLDDVREALGYPRIDLYGASYGTRVAQAYMRHYPLHMHAAVLDGVTAPETPIGPSTPFDGEHALDLIVQRCEKTTDCAAAYPALRAELAALRRRFGPEHVTLTLNDPRAGTPLTLDFNRSVLSAALRFLSYSATEAAIFPALIHQAAAGNLDLLASQTILFARSLGDQLASGMQNSVVCSEDVPLFDAAPIDRAAMAATYLGTEQIDNLREICALWPKGPVDADLHQALHSDIPTLLLSGEADPVTPPRDAERAAHFLTRHRHLMLAGEGHGQLAAGCMPRLIADFLDHGDPAKLDATCLDQHTPQPFFLSLTGPAP